MDPAAKLLIGAIGSVVAGLLFVACFATPDDRAEATRAVIRNTPTACALYMGFPPAKREPALDEICQAVALAEFDSDAVRTSDVDASPVGTGSAVQPTQPELPDGGTTDASLNTEQGNAMRRVDAR